MGSTTASPRARLWLAVALCLLAAFVPPRGLAICLGEEHAEGRTAWGVAEGQDRCPCDHRDARPDSNEDDGQDDRKDDGEHRDLEVPALAEVTRSDVGSTSLGRVLERGFLAAAVQLDPLFALPRERRAEPLRRPPPPRRADRCRRTDVLRI